MKRDTHCASGRETVTSHAVQLLPDPRRLSLKSVPNPCSPFVTRIVLDIPSCKMPALVPYSCSLHLALNSKLPTPSRFILP